MSSRSYMEGSVVVYRVPGTWGNLGLLGSCKSEVAGEAGYDGTNL